MRPSSGGNACAPHLVVMHAPLIWCTGLVNWTTRNFYVLFLHFSAICMRSFVVLFKRVHADHAHGALSTGSVFFPALSWVYWRACQLRFGFHSAPLSCICQYVRKLEFKFDTNLNSFLLLCHVYVAMYVNSNSYSIQIWIPFCSSVVYMSICT